MCGIVGYVGSREAVPLIIAGLSRLEYRGYDSAGLAVQAEENLVIRKAVGRLSNLEVELEQKPVAGHTAIGHTRWATHGSPSLQNCHPHANTDSRLAIVHNGIIENYQELKEELQAKGSTFTSETDTEVICHLIEEIDKSSDLLEHFRLALNRARGAYALGMVHADRPDTLYAARLGSPLIIGIGADNEYFIASDVPAIIKEAKEVIYLEDGELAELGPRGIRIISLNGEPVQPKPQAITFEAESADRAGFETYMLKEIYEQPRVLRALLDAGMPDGHHVDLASLELNIENAASFDRVFIISCGTAYYAGMYGRMMLEQITDIPAEIDLGSEFRYCAPRLNEKTLVIAVSQSGETADTLASIHKAKEKGCTILSICNVPGSSLVRESHHVLYTNAGPEIGVASTKAYTGQLMAFALLAHGLAHARGTAVENETAMMEALRDVPDLIHYVLARSEHIAAVADKHHEGPSALYLGRRFNYPTALEGALKNKEISYQHAEGYAAGEMKHGPIALISEYMPVICICTSTEDEVYEKMISNMREVEARNGRIIAVATDGDTHVETIAEDILWVPYTQECYSPIVNVVALQLFAYFSAQARGTDIDKPRNLAKSVTVE